MPLIPSEEENAVTAERDEEVRSGGAAVHPGEAGAPAGHAGGHADAEPRKASRVPFPRRSDSRENPMYAGDRSTTTTP